MKEIRKCLVDLCASHGTPLAIVDAPPMKTILNMATAPSNQAFTIKQTREDIGTVADEVRKAIAQEVKGKSLCLMVDTASRFGRSVIVIYVQFIDGDRLLLRCLGIIALEESHTAAYIARVIKTVLDKYGITINQIFSLTTDNAANMLKTRKELQLLGSISNDCGGETVSSAENIDIDMFDMMLNDETVDMETAFCQRRTIVRSWPSWKIIYSEQTNCKSLWIAFHAVRTHYSWPLMRNWSSWRRKRA